MPVFTIRHRPVVRYRLSGKTERYSSLDKAAAAIYYPVYRWSTSELFLKSPEAVGFAFRSFGLRYADGSDIPLDELQRVFGPRHEDEHAVYRGSGPVLGIHKSGGRYRVYRHPKTTGAKRAHAFVDVEAGEPPVRAKRTGPNIPDAWDDCPRSDYDVRSWKRQRRTQWK